MSDGSLGTFDGDYWRHRWDVENTGWRIRERAEQPFDRNILALCKQVHPDNEEIAALPQMPPQDAEAKKEWEKAVHAALSKLLRGATVFIPLCGDTLALGYFARLGADVIGVDIAEHSIAAALREQFAESAGWKWDREPDVGDGYHHYTATRDDAGRVTLVVGDAMSLMEGAAKHRFGGFLESVDVVYDRASMVAIEPKMRPRYVAGINRLLALEGNQTRCLLCADSEQVGEWAEAIPAPDKNATYTRARRVLVLTTIERPDDEHQRVAGPPFHISQEDVERTYGAATHPRQRVTPHHDLAAHDKKLNAGKELPWEDHYYTVIRPFDAK